MTKKILPVFLLASLISFSAQPLIASDDDYYEDEYKDDRTERVYGWELMTDEELAAHREKMRSLDTKKERWEYRKSTMKKCWNAPKKKTSI